MTLDEATGIWMASFNAWCEHPLPANERVAREAAATVIQQAFAERDGEMFGGTLNDDLRFILGQPSFTFIRHAQIWRAAGHNLPHRAEDEQAFFIGRMLHHYLTVPSEWHDSWADEIEAVQNEARQALAAKGDSRG